MSFNNKECTRPLWFYFCSEFIPPPLFPANNGRIVLGAYELQAPGIAGAGIVRTGWLRGADGERGSVCARMAAEGLRGRGLRRGIADVGVMWRSERREVT